MANELMNTTEEMGLTVLTGGNGLTPEEIAEELGGDMPDYPRVKIPSGGAVVFEVPGDDPENPEPAKELCGVVVFHNKANAYWANSELSDAPPDCASDDGICGVGNPGGCCDTCPMNQMGSGEGGKGKACKNMERLFILMPGGFLPLSLSLPPTSLKAWRTYKTMLVSKSKRVCDVFTKITLTKKQNKAGQPYAEAVFKIGQALTPELAHKAYEYRQSVRAMLEAQKRTGASGGVTVNAETGEVIEK